MLKHKGILIKDFAVELRLSQPTVSSYLNQGTAPSERTVRNMADILGVSPDYLYGKGPDMELPEEEKKTKKKRKKKERGKIFNHNRIRARLAELGMTNKDLADKVGLGISTINHYTSGHCMVAHERMELVADALETTVEYLIGYDDEEEERMTVKSKLNEPTKHSKYIMRQVLTLDAKELKKAQNILAEVFPQNFERRER